jgi:hypothetical protein
MKDKHVGRGQFFHWRTHTEQGQVKRPAERLQMARKESDIDISGEICNFYLSLLDRL